MKDKYIKIINKAKNISEEFSISFLPNKPIILSQQGEIKNMISFKGVEIHNAYQIKELGRKSENFNLNPNTQNKLLYRGQSSRQYSNGGMQIAQYYNEMTITKHVASGSSKGTNAVSFSLSPLLARCYAFGLQNHVICLDANLFPHITSQQSALIKNNIQSDNWPYKIKSMSELQNKKNPEHNCFYIGCKQDEIEYVVIDPSGKRINAIASYKQCGIKRKVTDFVSLSLDELAGILSVADVRDHINGFPVPTSGGYSVAYESEMTAYCGIPDMAVLGWHDTYTPFILKQFTFNELYFDPYSSTAEGIEYYFNEYLPQFQNFLNDHFDPQKKKIVFENEINFKKYLDNELEVYSLYNRNLEFSGFQMAKEEEERFKNQKYSKNKNKRR
ncbi:MAG: hypothetical protein HYX60_05705 [Legionella longbeachae]|nr:hypothetical protein [Legionella longbeachae]